MKAPYFPLRPLAVALLAAAGAAPGATNSLEQFDYSEGSSIGGQNGGQGWLAAWTAVTGNGTILAEPDSLTYPGISPGGGKMHFSAPTLTGTTTTSYRYPTNALISGTHYIRYLAQSLNGSARYFGVALFNTSEQTLLGQGSGFNTWTLNHVDGITNALFTNMLVSTVVSTNLSLLVLKLELQDGGPERVTFWVNPDLSQPESASTAVGGGSFLTDRDFGQITRFRIGGGGYSATFGDPTEHYFDELLLSEISPFAAPDVVGRASNGTVALSWPAEYLGWTLQTNGTELADGLAWGDVADTRTVTSTNLPASSENAAVFYRLRSP